jgi:hypothetical protein
MLEHHSHPKAKRVTLQPTHDDSSAAEVVATRAAARHTDCVDVEHLLGMQRQCSWRKEMLSRPQLVQSMSLSASHTGENKMHSNTAGGSSTKLATSLVAQHAHKA